MHPTQTNEFGWEKDTKQKNAINQICQKIQSFDQHKRRWYHITKQFVLCEKAWKVYTHLHGGQHSHDVICQNHWRSYFHHISQCVLISLKQQNLQEHDRFYCAGITAINFLNNLASTSQRQVLIIKLQYLKKHCVWMT